MAAHDSHQAGPVRPINVLMVNDALSVGGAERVAVDVANTLDRDRHVVSFCATRSDGPLRARLRPDVDVTILGRANTWDVGKLTTFARLVRDREIDIIHSHGRGTMKFVALARRLGLVDVAHVFHDHFGWLHTDRGASRGLRMALRGVDTYIGVDARLCAWAVGTAGLDPAQVHLVRSGVDVERFVQPPPADLRAELGIDPDEDVVILLMIANFRPQKDHPTLFRAMAALPPDVLARMRLVVCGDLDSDVGYHAGCVAIIERLGIGPFVHLLGRREDVAPLLAAADGAVLSSKNETGPLVVLEYMAAGLPFVATDTGEIARAVRDLGVGFLPAPRDHLDVAAALEAIVTMTPGERAAMGAAGRRQAAGAFSQAVATAAVEQLYRQALGLSDAPAPTLAPL